MAGERRGKSRKDRKSSYRSGLKEAFTKPVWRAVLVSKSEMCGCRHFLISKREDFMVLNVISNKPAPV